MKLILKLAKNVPRKQENIKWYIMNCMKQIMSIIVKKLFE